MSTYTFDKLSLAIAVTKDEMARLMSGEQIAVLKNTRTPFKSGIKCYFYETKTGGGRSQFVAIGELEDATFYKRDGSMRQDCGLTEEADQTVRASLRAGTFKAL